MAPEKDSVWTFMQITILWDMARCDLPTHEIARRLDKPQALVDQKIKELGIPFSRPTLSGSSDYSVGARESN